MFCGVFGGYTICSLLSVPTLGVITVNIKGQCFMPGWSCITTIKDEFLAVVNLFL